MRLPLVNVQMKDEIFDPENLFWFNRANQVSGWSKGRGPENLLNLTSNDLMGLDDKSGMVPLI